MTDIILSLVDHLTSCSLPVQVPESVVETINTEVGNVRKLLEGETSAESIKEAVSNLQKALMKIGEHLAQSGQVKVMQLLLLVDLTVYILCKG